MLYRNGGLNVGTNAYTVCVCMALKLYFLFRVDTGNACDL